MKIIAAKTRFSINSRHGILNFLIRAILDFEGIRTHLMISYTVSSRRYKFTPYASVLAVFKSL